MFAILILMNKTKFSTAVNNIMLTKTIFENKKKI